MHLSAAGLRAVIACLLCACASAFAQTVQRFDIFEFRVEGNTVLGTEAIERAVYPFMGEQKSIDDVEAARTALEKAYHDAGYSTAGVDIPEQRVAGGVVALKVVQAEVSRLRVTGSRYFSQGRIVEQVPGLAEGQVPNLREVQDQLAGVNRSADRRVTPLLRPGKAPGTTEVDLQVQDELPLHGSVELNNRAIPNTSATRLTASLHYDNLWQREHSLAMQVQTSPERSGEVKVFAGTYTVPLALDQLIYSLIRSDSRVAAGVGDTTVFGKGTIWGLKRNVLIALREGEYHALALGADYKDFNETVDAGTGTGFSTPLRYLPFSASYTGLVDDRSGQWQIGAGIVFALRGLASDDAQFANKRFGATGGFAVLKLDLGREHKLAAGFSLAAKADLQFSQQPLVSNEQFVVGGVDSVRGYLESAAVGDDGARLSLELRTPEMAGKGWPVVTSLTAHAFVDGAATEIRQPLPGQQQRFRLLSGGLGLRLKAQPYGSLALDLGMPLKTLGNTRRGDLRLHAAGTFEF